MVSLPPIFNRRGRRHDEAGLPTHSHQKHSPRRTSSATRVAAEQYNMRQRPTFKQWVKLHWLDLLTMAIFGAITLGIFQAPLVTHRSFPVRQISNSGTADSGDIIYPQFAYPHQPQIVPNWAATIVAMFFPILVMGLAQIRVRSFWDFNNGVIGLLNSLVLSTFCQILLKWLIGGLRPNFYDTCKPDVSLAASRNSSGMEGVGYGGIMYTNAICTGDTKEIDNALESWPSGHTTAAFAGFVYLSLYLNGKLKVFSNYHPALWKLALVYFPVLCAVLIGGSLTIDGSHNWYDIFSGAAIGIAFAFSAYRTVYVSVWDWRTNHMPLHRGVPFAGDVEDAVGARWTMTRKAGWGRRGKGGKAAAAAEKLGGQRRHASAVDGDGYLAGGAMHGGSSRNHRHHHHSHGSHQNGHDDGSSAPRMMMPGGRAAGDDMV